MTTIQVSHEFHGYSDYWGGNGRRWDVGAGCLFASYGPDTSLRDCVDQWVSDFYIGGDFEPGYDVESGKSFRDAFEDIGEDDIREAILTNLLNNQGRADYKSGALCEFAAHCEDNRVCNECGASIGQPHEDGCAYVEDDDVYDVEPDDCDDCDDLDEYPQWIILIEIEVCSECGAGCDHTVDDLCADCGKKHYPDHFDDDGELVV